MKTNFKAYVTPILFALLFCGCGEGGSQEFQADFSDAEVLFGEMAVTFFNDAGDMVDSSTKTKLYKTTSSGSLLPVFTTSSGEPAVTPQINRVVRDEDGSYFVNFYGLVTLGGEKCALIHIETSGEMKCVDSEEFTASDYRHSDRRVPYREEKRDLMFSKTPSGDILYVNDGEIYVRRAGGNVEDFLPDEWFIRDIVKDSAGVLYGQGDDGCINVDPVTYEGLGLTVTCRINLDGSVDDLHGSLNASLDDYLAPRVIALSNDRTIVTTDYTIPLHLRVGKLGDPVTTSTYVTDLKANPGDSSVVPETTYNAGFFETDGGKIFISDEPLLQIEPTLKAIPLTGSGEMKSLDYRSGGDIIASACADSDCMGVGTKLFRIDPSTGNLTELPQPANVNVEAVRYISDTKLAIRTSDYPTSGYINETFTYWIYDLTTHDMTKLFSAVNAMYAIYPTE